MESKKVVKFFIIILIFIFVLQNVILGETSPWTLKAEKIEFFWENQTFYAYGNVEIKGKEIWILADKVEGNIRDGWIKATGNVRFKEARGEFIAQEIKYFFKKDTASLIQVSANYTSPEIKGKLYLSGKELEWEKGNMLINNGKVSTCELENPHYYLSASKITYISDDKIILDGVYLKFIFLPFSIPLFKYVISLKKEPIPFPQLGFDGQYIFLSYPISYSILGQLGLLSLLLKYNIINQEKPYIIEISQNYSLQNIKGIIKLNLSGLIDFENQQYPNLILNWGHEQKIANFLILNNSFVYNLNPNENLYSFQNILRSTFTYGLNKSSLQLTYIQDNISKRFGSILNISQGIDKNNNLNLNIRYNDSTISDRRTYEFYQDGKFIHKGKNYTLSIFENYRISTPQNLQLIKLPEITFNGTYSIFKIPLKLDGILGYYNEPSSYTKSGKLSFGISIPYSFRTSNFNLNSTLGYKQDFYETGDQRYFLYGNISSGLKPFKFLSLSANYNFQFLGRDIITGDLGNTPFYFDYQGENNMLSCSMIIGDPNINITFSDSYNFLLNSLSPLNIRGKLDYKKIIVIEGNTSYNWKEEKFSPILIQGVLNYSFLSLSIGALLYPYLVNPLQRLDYKLSFNIEGDWHFAGKLTLLGTYPSNNPYPFITLDKDLHCFIGKFSWNPNDGNIQFEISLKAIPTKKIGGAIGPSGFTLLPSF
jgi:LPS-assembly protein